MKAPVEFLEFVKKNGACGGDGVCRTYRLVKRLSSDNLLIANLNDPYDRGDACELSVYVSRAFDYGQAPFQWFDEPEDLSDKHLPTTIQLC